MFRNGGANLACVFGQYAKNKLSAGLGQVGFIDNHLQPVRYMGKHYDPKFKKQRKEKVFERDKRITGASDSLNYYREELKLLGKFPVNMRRGRPISLFSSLTLIDPYEPPRGDGKYSDLLTKGHKTTIDLIKKKQKNLTNQRKLKKLDPSFGKDEFLELAKDIYIKAHTALADDPESLIQYVTEHAHPRMTANRKYKIIKWKFIESLEPLNIMQMRIATITEDTSFGQITVRFNTQQTLAIYDRFGRLMQGSEILKKDVLEYIVFEKNLSIPSSTWRLHAKILPSETDMQYYTVQKTYIQPKTDLGPDEIEERICTTESDEVFDTLSK